MRKILSLFLLLSSFNLYSQCVGIQSFTVSPVMANYPGGTQVQICYTMQGWNGNSFSANWIEGFQVAVSPSLTNLTPVSGPSDCDNIGTGTGWIWAPTITSSSTGLVAGPGWFYEVEQGTFPGGGFDNDPGNDWGDFGSTCTWSFCFSATVIDTCVLMPISATVTAGADGTWGSWGSNVCALVPFQIPIGQNDPIEFESIANSPLVDSVCVGESTTHTILDTTGLSIFNPSNPLSITWNSPGINQVSIIEETSQGCKDTTYFTINVLDLPEVDIQDVGSLCQNDDPIQISSSPLGGIWNPFGPIFNPQSGPSWIFYSYQDQYGCQNSDSTFIIVNPNPFESIISGPDSIINCVSENRIVMYSVSATDGSIYHWELNGLNLPNQTGQIYVEFPNISDYVNVLSVYEENQYGCIGPESEIAIYSEECGEVFIPNIFSPNGDNNNEVFKIFTISTIESFQMGVYDRWGSIIYNFKNQNDSWSGELYPNDVYVYKFMGKISGRRVDKIGHVTILR